MKSLIILGYEFLASFIPFFAVFLMCRYLYEKRGVQISRGYEKTVIIFAVYVIAVYHITGTGTLHDGLLYQLDIKHEFNIIPFSNDIDAASYLLNILLFIPFGVLVPFIRKKRADFISITAAGFAFSLLIESSQLLNHRSTDIDDLLMNTIGAILGFALYKIWIRFVKKEPGLTGISGNEWIYIAALFLGRFLLFSEIGIVRLLYGF